MSDPTPVSSHPSSAVLLDHVTGAIGFAHGRVVATHLLHCPLCRDTVSYWETIAGRLLADSRPVPPPAALLERCIASIEQDDAAGRRGADGRIRPPAPRTVGDTVLPPSLDGLQPGRLRWLAPGIRHSTLWRDERSTLHLLRVDPGVALPAHRHRGLELTCVLSGAYRDDDRVYAVGDLSEEDDADESNPRGDAHHVIAAEPHRDCVCLLATDGRLRFRGWLARLLQPVMPF